MKVEIILKEDIKGVGKKNEVVKVSEGYANNFLIKTNKGVLATKENLNKLKEQKAKKEKDHKKHVEQAMNEKKILESKVLVLKIKSGASGKVFGSIGSKDIAELINKELNLEIDKRKIVSNTARLKEIGSHIVEIKLYQDIKADVKVNVIGE